MNNIANKGVKIQKSFKKRKLYRKNDPKLISRPGAPLNSNQFLMKYVDQHSPQVNLQYGSLDKFTFHNNEMKSNNEEIDNDQNKIKSETTNINKRGTLDDINNNNNNNNNNRGIKRHSPQTNISSEKMSSVPSTPSPITKFVPKRTGSDHLKRDKAALNHLSPQFRPMTSPISPSIASRNAVPELPDDGFAL